MTKTFCDVCGKELLEKAANHVVARRVVNNGGGHTTVDLTISVNCGIPADDGDDIGVEGDVCLTCIIDTVDSLDPRPQTATAVTGSTSDGYHTFGELYEHRNALFITMLSCYMGLSNIRPWRSKLHSDGSHIEGYFLLGLFETHGSQITYHLPIFMWDECPVDTKTLAKAPEFDGHTSADVLQRIRNLS